MTAIVRIALERPYTFIVMSLMIFIGGILAAIRTPVDIFPEIRIPVVASVWNYYGLSPALMSQRVMDPFQGALSAFVTSIEHVETQSLPGVGYAKIFLQPGADVRIATAQVSATGGTSVRQMPPGITPPAMINYTASTVPILQLAISGKGLTEQQLADLASNVVRVDLVTVPGALMPQPYGGKPRQIQIDVDPEKLQSKGLAGQDIGTAIANQNQMNPAGFLKIGNFQYNLNLNNQARTLEDLANVPIKTVGGATVYLRDVAHVRDGSAPQTNVVHVDGSRSVLMTVLKTGATSTLAVVEGIKGKLGPLAERLPDALKIVPINDQSLFVEAAIGGVVREGAIAALLTSFMILMFLGSWRSTVIIVTSIPLAVLAAVALLAAFGETLNIMTLGGLALAVGILIDDATVTIENINWHLESGKGVIDSIMDGARQIVTPAFVSLLCICIVFVPMFFLPGVSGFLFVPMAMSVIFAMIASFILSRTLVPTMAMYLLKPHTSVLEDHAPTSNALVKFQRVFAQKFEDFRGRYRGLLGWAVSHRKPFVIGFMACVVASFLLYPFLGANFFPSVDGRSITLHVRAPAGTRIEETSRLFDEIAQSIRAVIPASEVASVVDNIGIPNSGINTVYNASGTVGPQDGDIIVGLTEDHRPTTGYIKTLREKLPREFPAATFSFLPSDIVSQILNFGSPAPIDIQVLGGRGDSGQLYAQQILREVRKVPGLVDARIQQTSQYPELRFDADRVRMAQIGLTERDVTNGVASALAGSTTTSPVYWTDPATNFSYLVAAQTPEYQVDSVSSLQNIPVTSAANPQNKQVLGGLGKLSRGASQVVVSSYNRQNLIDIFASTQDRDLGAVAADIQKVLKSVEKDRPRGVNVILRGQYATMNTAFTGMGLGILAAVVLIYLIIVINFQSWTDSFVIITALPAALAGIVWFLFMTGTELSVPALTGALMCMGVGTANSILVVSFAREKLKETGDAVAAALDAGYSRFRPVLMTALAMIIGMAPMALGLGEGGEQNAPLGRAVIGGLILATIATLIFVPVVFAIVHSRKHPTPQTVS